jgi:hypothetical protein
MAIGAAGKQLVGQRAHLGWGTGEAVHEHDPDTVGVIVVMLKIEGLVARLPEVLDHQGLVSSPRAGRTGHATIVTVA